MLDTRGENESLAKSVDRKCTNSEKPVWKGDRDVVPLCFDSDFPH